ncbi:MAG: N-acetyltransferase [Alphaproteobacteria bacterium]|nr:MAG: N-acetyltransferase [Alphaproteobacteria bacterium]
MTAEMEPALRLRAMTAGDLACAQRLSRSVKWPHRVEDWALCLDVGFGVVAEWQGDVVGTAMGWPYGSDAAALGMVLVDSYHQGRGIGRRLTRAVMERLDERTILLNATEEGLPLYRSLGFQETGSIEQHQGAAFSVPVVRLQAGERVRPLGQGDVGAIIALDKKATGFCRDALISRLLKNAQAVVLDRGGSVAGFALFRRFGRGYVVGPTVAPDLEGAKALIGQWIGAGAGMFIRIDVPGVDGLSQWLDNLGIVRIGRAATMARGTLAAKDGTVQYFSIAAQAFG